MKSIKIYYICMIMILIFASGCSEKNREESEKEMGSGQNNLEESTVNTEGLQVIDIHEKIMDNLLIEAKVNVYGKKYKSYQTSYKNFDVEKMTTLFMPDAKEDELQIDRSEDGSMITHQEETININPGILRYSKDKEIIFISELFSLAEFSNRLESRELKFMSSRQAADKAAALIEQLGLGTITGEAKISGFTKEDLTDIQKYFMEYDEDFRVQCETGKLQSRDHFQDEDEMYRIKYVFEQDGLPVFGFEDPPMQMMGGIDAPLLATPMEATVYISSSGVRRIELYGAVDGNMKVSEDKEIILLDDVKKALIKKYEDVILTQEMKVTDIWLEYVPVIDIEEDNAVDLIPVWCCESYIDHSNEEEGFSALRYADRFHAFTGEAIQ